MRFCSQCGTPAVASYCKRCGAPTPSTPEWVEAPTPSTDASGATPAPAEEGGSAAVETGPAWLKEMPTTATPAPVVPARLVVTTVEQFPEGDARRQLAWETRFVMAAFLLPVIANAVVALARSVAGIGDLQRFPTIMAGHPLANMFIGIVAYLSVASVVPLALFLLNRTGQSPKVLGLGVPNLKEDLLPAVGIGLGSFGIEVVMLVPLIAVVGSHSSLIQNVSVGSYPKYYLIFGIAVSAITAIAEEVMMNGYFMTRLHQLGWSPRSALLVSLTLRTSYHVYYGLGFLMTVPFGYLVTRSFQKHHKLNRPILAHFLFDAVLFSIAILK